MNGNFSEIIDDTGGLGLINLIGFRKPMRFNSITGFIRHYSLK